MSEIKLPVLKRCVQTGTINIQNKSLPEIPGILFTLYEMDIDGVTAASKKDITKVVLSNNELTTITPKLTATYQGIKEITAMSCKISQLEDALFEHAASLRTLNLAHNSLTALTPAVAVNCADSLTHLLLPHNALTELPPEIAQLSHLQELDVSNNKISRVVALPLPRLLTLNMAKNKIQALPDSFFTGMTSVKTIDLSMNRLEAIPTAAGLGACGEAETVDISSNSIALFQCELGHVDEAGNGTAIKTLNLSMNRLTELPPDVLRMKKLATLTLDNNKIAELPPEIQELSALRTFSIKSNELKRLPPELANIKGIKHINATTNLIRTIPSGKLQDGGRDLVDYLRQQLAKLSTGNEPASSATAGKPAGAKGDGPRPDHTGTLSLVKQGLTTFDCTQVDSAENVKVLDLSKNVLDSDAVLDFSPLEGLKELTVTACKISSVPLGLEKLEKLEKVNLSENALTGTAGLQDIPDLKTLNLSMNPTMTVHTVGMLPLTLTDLNLSYCGLTDIPESLFFLEKLTSLCLARNKLTEIPPDEMPVAWPKLSTLDLSYNDIRKLNRSVALFKKLRNLLVEGNPLVMPSRAVVNRGSDAIIKYFQDKE